MLTKSDTVLGKSATFQKTFGVNGIQKVRTSGEHFQKSNVIVHFTMWSVQMRIAMFGLHSASPLQASLVFYRLPLESAR